MSRDYEGAATHALESHDTDAFQCEQRQWRKRAASFLARKGPLDDGQKPKKRHRAKSYRWMLRLDNAMMCHFGYGLKHYQQKPDLKGRCADPTKWWRLSLACDEGPDVRCAVSYMSRVLHLCIDYTPDFNHGIWNDVKLAIQDVGLRGHMLLAVVAYNNDVAPFGEERFYGSLIESFKEYLKVASCKTCPLFQELWPRILQDQGQYHRIGEPGVEEEVWQDH